MNQNLLSKIYHERQKIDQLCYNFSSIIENNRMEGIDLTSDKSRQGWFELEDKFFQPVQEKGGGVSTKYIFNSSMLLLMFLF